MSPIGMTVILVATLSALAYSLNRRWQLIKVAAAPENRADRIPERVWVTLKYAFGQYRMPYYPLAGVAHILIFFGFMVLLLRSLLLWGRAFVPDFNLWVLGPEPTFGIPLGHLYDLSKDIAAIIVIMGASAFVYLRVVVKDKRMSLHWEGLAILGIIIVMMLTDILYDGAMLALRAQLPSLNCGSTVEGVRATCEAVDTIVAPIRVPNPPALGFLWFAPAGSVAAMLLKSVPAKVLIVLAHCGFWTHSTLVLVFANLLPYTKHFHIFTVMPNVFTADLSARGRIKPMAKDSEELMEIVGNAAELDDPNEARIGVARAEHFSWKAVLDFYTCTECGRCSDNCPANTTGKVLSPKHLTVDLRNHFYKNDAMLIDGVRPEKQDDEHEHEAHTSDEHNEHGEHHEKPMPDNPIPNPPLKYEPIDLVENVVKPDVFWGCTTCRACEEFCPVLISYVDKIVDLRRNQVLVQGEFPPELAKPFEAMETNGNPWNLSRMDRAAWAEGLDIPTMADKPDSKVLYWVGCAASYDDRAKKVARALVRLLKEAGVEFAILGEEETCTGDSARRAGNEFLFAMLAEANVEVLNGYQEQGGIKTIITACPHCFNTLASEYKDFGGNYEVIHHSDYLFQLVRDGKLKPKNAVKGRVVFHDSCYLGRYNDIYDSPRDVLRDIPGLELVEPERYTRNMGVCCGAGGAQMWMEEQNKDRMNVRRTLQLLEAKPEAIATACPFCMTMLTDGLKDQEKEDDIQQLDIAEILAQSCLDEEKTKEDSEEVSSQERSRSAEV
ncbi:MAG: iron-sulfur protein [Sorangium cellulosum]|nr:MAG: iron-sulfur protein [Sorangium cellulosum]